MAIELGKDIYSDEKFLKSLMRIIGRNVSVTLCNKEKCCGVLRTVSHKGDVVLTRAQMYQGDTVISVQETLIFPLSTVVVVTAHGISDSPTKDPPSALMTDADIGLGKTVSTERELQQFDFEGEETEPGLLSVDLDKGGGWASKDMLVVNEKIYGVKSTLSKDLSEYTTELKVSDSPEFIARQTRAARIAGEIEGKGSNQRDVSEEDMFSAVYRPAQHNVGMLSCPTQHDVDVSRPAQHNVDVSRPAQHNVDVSRPAQHNVDVSRPTQHNVDVSRPAQHNVDVSRPTQHNVDVSRPAQHNVDVTRPAQHNVDVVSRPAQHNVDVSCPAQHNVDVSRPAQHNDQLLRTSGLLQDDLPLVAMTTHGNLQTDGETTEEEGTTSGYVSSREASTPSSTVTVLGEHSTPDQLSGESSSNPVESSSTSGDKIIDMSENEKQLIVHDKETGSSDTSGSQDILKKSTLNPLAQSFTPSFGTKDKTPPLNTAYPSSSRGGHGVGRNRRGRGEMSPSHSFGSPSHTTVPMIPANQQPSPQVMMYAYVPAPANPPFVVGQRPRPPGPGVQIIPGPSSLPLNYVMVPPTHNQMGYNPHH